MFTEALARSIPHFADGDGWFVASFSDEDRPAIVSPEEAAPFLAEEGMKALSDAFAAAKPRVENRNDGSLVRKKFRSWAFVPAIAKKKTLCAAIIVRERGSFSVDEQNALRDLSAFLTQELRDARARNKKANGLSEETRHRLLLRTQSSLERKESSFPGFARAIDFGAGTGSDMAQLYRQGEDVALACACDVTADDHERHAGLIYLDTWFAILAQTSLSVRPMLSRLNIDMQKRSNECYASVAVAKYDRRARTVELGGMGSAIACVFDHAQMTARVHEFGTACGIQSDDEPFTTTFAVKPGDIVALCTDGLAASRKSGGGLIGAETISELVRRNYFLSANDLAQKILTGVAEAAEKGVNADDRTVEVLKIE